MHMREEPDDLTNCGGTTALSILRSKLEPHLEDNEITGHWNVFDKCSRLLLDLYQLAMSSPIGEFEEQIFLLLKEYFTFDSAWLGRSTNFLDGPVLHNSYLYNLPKEFVADWEQVKACDGGIKIKKTIKDATKPVVLSLTDEGHDELFRRFLGKYAIAQFLGSVCEDPLLHLWTHLALYKNSLLPAISDQEIELMKYTMPHLASALNLNRVQHMRQLKTAKYSPNTSFAISDKLGTLQYADASFADLMLMEWPEWNRATLPRIFLQWQQEKNANLYSGRMITLQADEISDLLLINAKPRSTIDFLTRRELAVIRLYAEGMTYKEVAKILEISPTTVRYYLRQAYTKLKIQNKSEIAWLLSRDEP